MTGDLLKLAERVEALTGPDRDVDALAAPEQGLRVVDEGHPLGRCCYDANGRLVVLPRYTALLDAAMTLVPEGCWAEGSLGSHDTTCAALEIHAPMTFDPIGKAWAATPALALCAAALRARAHSIPGTPEEDNPA